MITRDLSLRDLPMSLPKELLQDKMNASPELNIALKLMSAEVWLMYSTAKVTILSLKLKVAEWLITI